jgi:hypothetical protein
MRIRIIATTCGLLLLLAGCANDSGAASSGPADAPSLTIVEPGQGANVTAPFTVRVQSSVPLGSTASGKHHVHVWFDGNTKDYKVVETDKVDIAAGSLTPGQHVIHASLRNADHSPAGSETQVNVTAAGAGGAAVTTPAAPGGYDY